jgi:hypothetical protein
MHVTNRWFYLLAVLLLIVAGLLYWLSGSRSPEPTMTAGPASAPETGQRPPAAISRQDSGYSELSTFGADPKRTGYSLRVKGRVLSKADRSPVSGADITFFLNRDPRTGRLENAAANVQSDSEGYFEMVRQELSEGALVIERAGFAAVEERIRPSAVARRERVYLLEPARAALTGIVLEATSRTPVPNAGVSTMYYTWLGQGDHSTPVQKWAVSDEGGRFSIEGIKAGKILFRVFARGHFGSPLEVDLGEEERRFVEILLVKGEERLLLIKNRTGEPVEGTAVLLGSPDPAIYAGDARGQVRYLVRKENEQAQLDVKAVGYLSRRITLDLRHDVHEVVLERTDPLKGRVLSESGNPIPGASVAAVSSSRGHSLSGQDAAETDEDGYFSMYPGGGQPEQLWVRRDGYMTETVILSEGSVRTDLEIRLRHPEAGISGRVLYSDGSPVLEFALHVRSLEGRLLANRFFSNAEGRFEILTLPAGTIGLEVIGVEDSGAPIKAGSVTLVKGQVAEVDIAVVKP